MQIDVLQKIPLSSLAIPIIKENVKTIITVIWIYM